MNASDRGAAEGGVDSGTVDLLQQNMQRIESGVAKVNGRALIAIQIEQRGGIIVAFAFQVKRLVARRHHFGDEGIQTRAA